MLIRQLEKKLYAVLLDYLFKEALVSSGETCSKYPMKTMGVNLVHISKNDQYSDYQNSPIGSQHLLMKCKFWVFVTALLESRRLHVSKCLMINERKGLLSPH